MNQILLPLLSVVPDEAVRTIIRETAESLQANIVSERGASTDGQVLSIVSKVIADTSVTASLAAIATAFTIAHGSDYERPITNRWVGSVLRRLGISLYKSNGVFVLLPGQETRISALCSRYGVGDARSAEDAQPHLKELSP